MSCNTKRIKTGKTVITIAGGVAIGAVAVAVVTAAPFEVLGGLALVGLTKVALQANEKLNKCNDPDHDHSDE